MPEQAGTPSIADISYGQGPLKRPCYVKDKSYNKATCMHGVTVVDVNLILDLFLATHT